MSEIPSRNFIQGIADVTNPSNRHDAQHIDLEHAADAVPGTAAFREKYVRQLAPVPTRRSKESVLSLPANEDGTIANEEDRKQLIEDFIPLSRFVAKKYFGRTLDREDINQEADLGLTVAAHRFDLTRGLNFTTFAVRCIRTKIQHALRDRDGVVRGPRIEHARKFAYSSAEQELRVSKQDVTDESIAKISGLAVSEVVEERISQQWSVPASLDEERADEQGATTTRYEYLPDPASAGYNEVEAKLTVEKLLEKLEDERLETILRLRFGLPPYDRPHNQAEIGKYVGYSQMHVSRLIRQALDRLRGFIAEEGAA